MNTATEKSFAIEQFTALSEVLTGHKNLAGKRDGERSLAQSYYEIIETAFRGERLTRLLSVFDGLERDAAFPNTAVAEHIMAVEELSEIAAEIIMLWYMSVLRPPRQLEGHQRSGDSRADDNNVEFLSHLRFFLALLTRNRNQFSGGYFQYPKYPPLSPNG